MKPQSNPKSITVYDYVDYRSYLADALAVIRDKDPAFSNREFARQAGLGAPNAAQRILEGQTGLRPKNATAIAKSLKLSAAETKYFVLLTRWSAARKTTSKQKLEADLRRARAHSKGQGTELQIFDLLASWEPAAIRELLRCVQQTATVEDIAARLYPRTSVKEVHKALKLLLDTGVVEQQPDGYRVTDKVLAGPKNVFSDATRSFNRKSLELATAAMVLPLDERSYGTLTIAVNARQQQEIFATLAQLHTQIRSAVNQAPQNADRVLHIGTYAIPVARKPDEDSL